MTRQALSGGSARRRGYYIQAVPDEARGVSLPAPAGGWNAITPISQMKPTDAVLLDNLFPQPGYLEIRKGHKRHNLVGAGAIDTLMPYHALSAANDKLFAACSSIISDVTVFTTASASATASVALSGLTNARWQFTNHSTSGGNFLWCCNGADAPRMYNGSVWATASVVGITAAEIINCAVFNDRLWLVRTGQISAAYLGTDAVQGTATPFSLAGVFTKGGFLQAIGTWSLDGGDGPDDHIAFITSRGEVAIYSGTDPAANFVKKGVYEMGAPIGRRCLTKVGADLAVISVDGVLPLSRALITDRAAAITESITQKIQPVMNASARRYKDNFGWQLTAYPRGTRAILNVPLNEGVEQQQYVMNVVTGAWARFKGENANCWAVFQDRLFYGGNDGIVREADCQGFDDDGAIEFDVETAFSYCGSKGTLKQFIMARTLLTSDGTIRPGLGLNVDFSRQATVGPTSFQQAVGALWDVATWDTGLWPQTERIVTDWQAVEGVGYCAAPRMAGSVEAETTADASNDFTMQINGWDLLVIDGAFL